MGDVRGFKDFHSFAGGHSEKFRVGREGESCHFISEIEMC